MCNSTTPAGQLGLTDANHERHCGGASANCISAKRPDGAVTSNYLVDGMTCSHCVASVTEELSELDGVERVDVDLNAGGASRVTVVSTAPIAAERISAAITEAGYSLSPAS